MASLEASVEIEEQLKNCTLSEKFNKNFNISEEPVDQIAGVYIDTFLHSYMPLHLFDQERRNRFIFLDFFCRGFGLPLHVNGEYDLVKDLYLFHFKGNVYHLQFVNGKYVFIINESKERSTMVPYTDVQIVGENVGNRRLDENSIVNLNQLLLKTLERVFPLLS